VPFPTGSDDPGDLLQGLRREYGPHLVIAHLVTLNAGDGPELLEQPGTVGVDGEGELAGQGTEPAKASRAVLAIAVPLDLPIAPWNDREAFGVRLDSMSFGKLAKPGERFGVLGLRPWLLQGLRSWQSETLL